jgi:O-antigen ligase
MLAYVSGAYTAAVATLVLFRHEADVLRRFAVGGVDPNDLAMKLALAVPMAWYLGSVYEKPWLRLFCRAYLPVGLLALGLTGSRGGMIVAFVALSIIPLSMDRLTPGRLVTALGILTLTGALAAAFVPDAVVHRLATTQNEVESASFGGRFKLWVAGLHAFTFKPLMGYGTGGFVAAIYSQLGAQSLVAHNSFISILVEEGIVGLVLYCIMLYAAVAAVMRLPRRERRFGQVLMAALLLALSPLTWEDVKPVWFILAVLVGLSQALAAAPAGRSPGRFPGGPLRVGSPIRRRPVGPVAATPGEGGM